MRAPIEGDWVYYHKVRCDCGAQGMDQGLRRISSVTSSGHYRLRERRCNWHKIGCFYLMEVDRL